MNKKTIAIAALALFATSGLASARTIHSPKTAQTSLNEAAVLTPQAQFRSSPYDAQNSLGDGAENQAYNHPGDNDMDRYPNQD